MTVVLSSVLTLGSGLMVGQDLRTGLRPAVDVRLSVASLEGGGLVGRASEDVYGVSMV